MKCEVKIDIKTCIGGYDRCDRVKNIEVLVVLRLFDATREHYEHIK